MKLEDITHVLCLSCVLMFFCVSSQPGCDTGWFGHQCKYKCHCENTSCNVDGSCRHPFTCEGGWFGPACQYADVAYRTVNLTEITDGNDTTCNVPNAGTTVTIPFSESVYFTWLRIHVTDQGSDTLRNMMVIFTFNITPVPCPVWRKQLVNKTVLDMHCQITQPVDEMTLAGQAVPHLCSVYISGGRNVALKETAWQPTDYILIIDNENYTFSADKAVDGNSSREINKLSCTHTYNTTTWSLTLSRQRNVHKYAIYNRNDGLGARLIGFKLESFDSDNHSVFLYEDQRVSYYEFIYSILHSPKPVQMIVVTVENDLRILSLCEVEIYGDSICDPQHYGRDCEHSCRCANNETCFVDTGGCTSGCAAGFLGDGCASTCSVGTFGMNCSQSCHPNCATSGQANTPSCDHETGLCNTGCQSGFSGSTCNKECSVGTFGANCNESCSPNCAASGRADVSSCDRKTGTCLKGCQSGFSGVMCEVGSPKASVASAGLPIELILGLGALFSVLFVAAFCVRRKGQVQQQAREGATSIAHPE